MTLLNFGSKPTTTSFVVSGVFTLLAIFALLYSVGIYLYRSNAIRTRKVAKFLRSVGSERALCVSLFVAIALNFGFEGRERQFL